MHFKKLLLAGVLLGVCTFTTPVGQIFEPIVVYADETSVSYDEEYSLITIKPVSGGKTYFSYKINGAYPTYTKDRVCCFNADGSLNEEKTGMLGTSIFSDDISSWIDVTTEKARVSQDSDYYNELRKEDCIAVLPYSEVNDTNEFYIPVTERGTSVTINMVNVSEDGTVSDIIEYSYIFTGVEQAEASKINAKVSSVVKKEGSEIITISGDKLAYVQLGSEFYTVTNNSVDIELTSNGVYTFIAYADDSMVQEAVTHTVDSIKTIINIKDDVLENIAPTITTDTIPTEPQTSAFKFKVYTDELAIISCDGVSVEGRELELNITGNGEYLVTATDKAGNYSEKVIVFDCFGTDNNSSNVIDRENIWGSNQTDKDVSDKTPTTGDIALASLIAIGGALASAGVVMVVNSKKGADSDVDLET